MTSRKSRRPRRVVNNPEYLEGQARLRERADLAKALAQRALVAKVARDAAKATFAAEAVRVAQRAPRGMGGKTIAIRDSDGYPANAVTLSKIPPHRAVRVDKQYWDARTLTRLLDHDPRATNPLTRRPFPAAVYARY